MDNGNSGAFLILFLASLPCLIGAYLIAVKKCLFLIAGWDPEKYNNHDAIAQTFAWGLFISGLMSLTVSALKYFSLISKDLEGTLILISAAIVILNGFYCNRTHPKKKNNENYLQLMLTYSQI